MHPAGNGNTSQRILEAARAFAAREGAGKITIAAVAKEAPAAMIAVLAIQGLRFQKLLKLPDGGADTKERVIERLMTMINELE